MPFGVVTNTRSPAFKQPNERTNDIAQLCTVKLDSGCARADRSDQRCRELVHIDYACDFGLIFRCEFLRSSADQIRVCACVRIESKWDSDYTADNTGARLLCCCAAVLLRTNWSVRFTLSALSVAVRFGLQCEAHLAAHSIRRRSQHAVERRSCVCRRMLLAELCDRLDQRYPIRRCAAQCGGGGGRGRRQLVIRRGLREIDRHLCTHTE